METKLHHKALNHSDDVGAFAASLIGLAGIFHVPEKLGITVDELAMALGFSFTILAFFRGRLEKARRSAVPPAPVEAPSDAAAADDDASG